MVKARTGVLRRPAISLMRSSALRLGIASSTSVTSCCVQNPDILYVSDRYPLVVLREATLLINS